MAELWHKINRRQQTYRILTIAFLPIEIVQTNQTWNTLGVLFAICLIQILQIFSLLQPNGYVFQNYWHKINRRQQNYWIIIIAFLTVVIVQTHWEFCPQFVSSVYYTMDSKSHFTLIANCGRIIGTKSTAYKKTLELWLLHF